MRQRTPRRLLSCVLLAAAGFLTGCGGGVATAPTPLPPATVPADRGEWARQFVLDFMAARAAGDDESARRFLSPTAIDQFAAGAGGLTLTDGGDGFASWALLAVEAADPSSYEVRVRVEDSATDDWEELLFVGIGPGPDGTPRELTVRGAQRLPAPTATGAGGGR